MHLQRIVVGVDFRAPSLAAVEWTARHLAPGAELVLAHAIAPAPADRPVPDREDAERRLGELAAALGARATVEVCDGDPAECLARLAAERGAELVVVGEHAAGPSPWIGTAAERLVRRSPVPVLVAAGELAGPPRVLLVPVAADDITERVFAWTRQLERRFDSKVAIVHVETPSGFAAVPVAAPYDPTVERRAATRERPTRWRRLVADRAPGRVFTDAVFGDATESILAEAERFRGGLVVLSDRTLESVREQGGEHPADRLLRDTVSPLLVVVDRAGGRGETDVGVER